MNTLDIPLTEYPPESNRAGWEADRAVEVVKLLRQKPHSKRQLANALGLKLNSMIGVMAEVNAHNYLHSERVNSEQVFSLIERKDK